MTKRNAESARVMADLLDAAADLGAYGLISKPDMARLNLLCKEPPVFTPEQVVNIRTNIAKTSQSVFASALNVRLTTVQKWESPKADRRPSGAAAKLLQLVEKKGLRAIMV